MQGCSAVAVIVSAIRHSLPLQAFPDHELLAASLLAKLLLDLEAHDALLAREEVVGGEEHQPQ